MRLSRRGRRLISKQRPLLESRKNIIDREICIGLCGRGEGEIFSDEHLSPRRGNKGSRTPRTLVPSAREQVFARSYVRPPAGMYWEFLACWRRSA